MLTFRNSLLLSLALVPSLATADTITQTVPFDYNANDGVTFPVIDGFDARGGTRELTRVTFEFRHNFEWELFVESTGPTPVAASDFELAFFYITLFQVGMGENPPFFGPGGMSVENASGDLGAYDGTPGNDGPDSYRRTFTQSLTVAQDYGPAEPDVLAAVTGDQPITTILGGFGETFIGWVNDPKWPLPPGGFPEYPKDAAIWTSTRSLRHFGEIIITYEYIESGTPCACDWNASGELNSQDFFDFVTAFFAGDADFNGDAETNSQDFFDFVTCFFDSPSGC